MSGFGSITAGDNIAATSVSASLVFASTAQLTTITGSSVSASADIKVGTNLTVGGGTPVTKMRVYNVTFSGWNSVNAGATSVQTGTLSAGSFSGLSTSDTLFVNGTNASNWTSTSCILFNVSASTNQAWFVWRNVGAVPLTPPIGTYKVFAITT